jgi:hypothetical protein
MHLLMLVMIMNDDFHTRSPDLVIFVVMLCLCIQAIYAERRQVYSALELIPSSQPFGPNILLHKFGYSSRMKSFTQIIPQGILAAECSGLHCPSCEIFRPRTW